MEAFHGGEGSPLRVDMAGNSPVHHRKVKRTIQPRKLRVPTLSVYFLSFSFFYSARVAVGSFVQCGKRQKLIIQFFGVLLVSNTHRVAPLTHQIFKDVKNYRSLLFYNRQLLVIFFTYTPESPKYVCRSHVHDCLICEPSMIIHIYIAL